MALRHKQLLLLFCPGISRQTESRQRPTPDLLHPWVLLMHRCFFLSINTPIKQRHRDLIAIIFRARQNPSPSLVGGGNKAPSS
jgi:hypothetical protein